MTASAPRRYSMAECHHHRTAAGWDCGIADGLEAVHRLVGTELPLPQFYARSFPAA